MEIQRFRKELALPSGVFLAVREQVIYLYGEAPIEWLTSNDARIRQLSADGRLVISALSASEDSVDELLRSNFDPISLAQLRISSSTDDGNTVLTINGQVATNEFAILSALFAGSRWVNINITQKKSGHVEPPAMQVEPSPG